MYYVPLVLYERGDFGGGTKNEPVTVLQPASRVALSMQVFAQAGMAATSPSMVPVVWAATEATKARTRAWEKCILRVLVW